MSQVSDKKIRITNDVSRKLKVLKYIWEDDVKSYSQIINKLINEHEISSSMIKGVKMKLVLGDYAEVIETDLSEDEFTKLPEEEYQKICKPYNLSRLKEHFITFGFQELVVRKNNLELELKEVQSEMDDSMEREAYRYGSDLL